jgi:AraC-like DNA-binding protein
MMKYKPKVAPSEPPFVSQQVTEARRYYLNLNPPRRADFVVVCGGSERMRQDYVISRRGFPYFCIELVAEGEGTLSLNGRHYDLVPGVVFAYGPGVRHTIRSDPRKPMRKYYIDFVGTEARSLLSSTGLGRWKPLRVSALHEIVELFDTLHREARDDSTIARTICENFARLLMLKIRQRAVTGGSDVPRSFTTYERLRLHVEAHYLRLRTVDEIAHECHVTPMYISRLFRRFGHTGAYHFLLRLRMSHAAELLLDEGLLVKEAAHRMGFSDAFQFSRAFKRVYGVPPTKLSHIRHEPRPAPSTDDERG